MAVDIRDYDERWPELAEAAIAELRAALPCAFTVIEHIGSTAVVGLRAKPVIDLMAAAEALDLVVKSDDRLGALGYQRLETGMPNRLFYQRDQNARRSHHLHVVPVDTWATRNERLLRDHLRTHPDDTARYAALKERLREGGQDREAYTMAKTSLIQELVDQARGDLGLPPVPVWEC